MMSFMRNLYHTFYTGEAEKVKTDEEIILAMSLSERNESLLHNVEWAGSDWKYDDHDWMKLLIKHGASLETKNKQGLTPLIIATRNRNVGLVAKLISEGANVDATTQEGATSLMIAAARVLNFPRNVHDAADEFQKIAETLIKNGASVNKRDDLGRTALMFVGINKDFPKAILYGDDRVGTANVGRGNMTRLLLRAGANPSIKDREGNTALDYLIKDAMDRLDNHDGVRLVAKDMDEMPRYEAFEKELTKLTKADEEERELRRIKYEKESAEKQARLFEQYSRLRANVIRNREKIMDGPKTMEEWPENDDFKKELFTIFKVINEANLWDRFRMSEKDFSKAISSNYFDIITRHPDVDACGHSGNTEVAALCVMKRIAEAGWEAYCKDVNHCLSRNIRCEI